MTQKNDHKGRGKTTSNPESAPSTGTGTGGTKVLVVYYSLTGTTKNIAERLRKKTGGDVFEIETVKDYPLPTPRPRRRPKGSWRRATCRH